MSLWLCHRDHRARVHGAEGLRAGSPSCAALGEGLAGISSTHHLPDFELPFPPSPSLFPVLICSLLSTLVLLYVRLALYRQVEGQREILRLLIPATLCLDFFPTQNTVK